MEEQPQSEVVYSLVFGEGKSLAHETAQALAQGVVEAFDVAGLAFGFARAAMRAPREHLVICQPEVAASGATTVVGRDALAQGTGTRPTPARHLARRPAAFRSRAGGSRLFLKPARDRVPVHAEDTLRCAQAQTFGGNRSEHFRLACRCRLPALGTQHPAGPARPATKLLVAADILAVFDDAPATAGCATRGSFRRQRGCSCHRLSSSMTPRLSFDQHPLPTCLFNAYQAFNLGDQFPRLLYPSTEHRPHLTVGLGFFIHLSESLLVQVMSKF